MRVAPRCFAVTGLAYLPPWSVNAGFIVGEEMTLVIDTGANAAAAATLHGYASAVRPSNGWMVLNTERHFDHIGGNSFFRDLGAPIYGHHDLERTEAEWAAEQDQFRAAIADPARRAAHEERAFYHATTLANPDRSVLDDMMLDLGRCPVEVLLTPGHTPTNISVWVPSDRVLYSGDCLVNLYAPGLGTGELAGRQWLASLDRIERLAPEAIVPGHGPVAAGAKEAAQLIAAVRERVGARQNRTGA